MQSEIFKYDDIVDCATLYAKVFSSPPWQENWTTEKAQTRVQHFYDCKGFVGITLRSQSELLGFCFGNSEPFIDGDIFYLREMCIAQEYQQKGLGKLLLSALEQHLLEQNIQSVYLTTDNRIPAAKFYLNSGFKFSTDMGFYMKSI